MGGTDPRPAQLGVFSLSRDACTSRERAAGPHGSLPNWRGGPSFSWPRTRRLPRLKSRSTRPFRTPPRPMRRMKSVAAGRQPGHADCVIGRGSGFLLSFWHFPPLAAHVALGPAGRLFRRSIRVRSVGHGRAESGSGSSTRRTSTAGGPVPPGGWTRAHPGVGAIGPLDGQRVSHSGDRPAVRVGRHHRADPRAGLHADFAGIALHPECRAAVWSSAGRR